MIQNCTPLALGRGWPEGRKTGSGEIVRSCEVTQGREVAALGRVRGICVGSDALYHWELFGSLGLRGTRQLGVGEAVLGEERQPSGTLAPVLAPPYPSLTW